MQFCVAVYHEESCEAETFLASCPVQYHVILLHDAFYGRMKLGRCVLHDYGYVGCYANVLSHMDALCSGRRTCSVHIPHPLLDRVNPCPRDFKTYLEVRYECVPGNLHHSAATVHWCLITVFTLTLLCGGNGVGRINKITPRQARLVRRPYWDG